MRQRYAVIPTRNRPQDFRDCVAAIGPQVDRLIVIHHITDGVQAVNAGKHQPDIDAETYPYDWAAYGSTEVTVLGYFTDPPNISAMWNHGIRRARSLAAMVDENYDVAILNDDVVVPSTWFGDITRAMRAHGAWAGCMSGTLTEVIARATDLTLPRMTGYAFVLAEGMEADPQFQWWFGDNDLDWSARRAGGVVHVPGVVEHRHPDSTTVGALRDIANQDADRFVVKWGKRPW